MPFRKLRSVDETDYPHLGYQERENTNYKYRNKNHHYLLHEHYGENKGLLWASYFTWNESILER